MFVDPGQLQVSTTTAADRHPEIFAIAAGLRPAARDVLSFGCSTGEEVATLVRHFPRAAISGIEISQPALATARSRYPEHAFYAPGEIGERRFDVIFAMSVLCRWPDDKGFLPYAAFRRGCIALDALLRPGGLLAIYNAAYDPLSCLPGYTPLGRGLVASGYVTVRDPHGTPTGTPNDFVFFEKPLHS